MKMSEKCRNNNSDNPLTTRRANGVKKMTLMLPIYGSQHVHVSKIIIVRIKLAKCVVLSGIPRSLFEL